MKKVAFVFITAVIAPSFILAWLAFRTLRDQQFLLERQQAVLYQGVADTLANNVVAAVDEHQRTLVSQVTKMLEEQPAGDVARRFDEELRRAWPLAQVGFVATVSGQILSPSPASTVEAKAFYSDHSRFLANRESAEIYQNVRPQANGGQELEPQAAALHRNETSWRYSNPAQQIRKVIPSLQSRSFQQESSVKEEPPQASKVLSAAAEFRQVIGNNTEGTIARYVDNKLNLLMWHRPVVGDGATISQKAVFWEHEPVFGALISLPFLIDTLRPVLALPELSLRQELCAALVDDSARPVALSHSGFAADWKRPLVAAEIGEVLPHWEVALYVLNPAKVSQSARALRLTLGLLISVMLLAIGVGSWLIFSDLNRQLALARQKTDFVSNVSHELKTPLTSIRMFSELLAGGRVVSPEKQHSYASIIAAETARLTRLINNVLDFSRIERGEKKYHLELLDLAQIARTAVSNYQPQLEANGFKLNCHLPQDPVTVKVDRDGAAQVILNLLSNAEKYSSHRKEIDVELSCRNGPLPCAELTVSDRGMGVPRGHEQKIFEKFYRADDSLSSGIQGSGLGLTLSRQIAHAHGGDVVYERREGGGSRFTFSLPLHQTDVE